MHCVTSFHEWSNIQYHNPAVCMYVVNIRHNYTDITGRVEHGNSGANVYGKVLHYTSLIFWPIETEFIIFLLKFTALEHFDVYTMGSTNTLSILLNGKVLKQVPSFSHVGCRRGYIVTTPLCHVGNFR